MPRLRFILVLITFLVPEIAVAVPAPSDPPGNLVFVESSDVKPVLERQKIATCMALLARDMSLVGKDLPPVVVLHISEKAGKTVGVKHSLVRRNSGKAAPDVYYELWIAGQGTAVDYAVSIEAILETHFGLSLSVAERKQVVTHVVRQLNATVSAYGE